MAAETMAPRKFASDVAASWSPEVASPATETASPATAMPLETALVYAGGKAALYEMTELVRVACVAAITAQQTSVTAKLGVAFDAISARKPSAG
eukprot:scaffold4779_cov116-Isochrysis_galbana.AAC.3